MQQATNKEQEIKERTNIQNQRSEEWPTKECIYHPNFWHLWTENEETYNCCIIWCGHCIFRTSAKKDKIRNHWDRNNPIGMLHKTSKSCTKLLAGVEMEDKHSKEDLKDIKQKKIMTTMTRTVKSWMKVDNSDSIKWPSCDILQWFIQSTCWLISHLPHCLYFW